MWVHGGVRGLGLLESFLFEGRVWVLASSGPRVVAMGVAGCELQRGLALSCSRGVSWAEHGIESSMKMGGSALVLPIA